MMASSPVADGLIIHGSAAVQKVNLVGLLSLVCVHSHVVVAADSRHKDIRPAPNLVADAEADCRNGWTKTLPGRKPTIGIVAPIERDVAVITAFGFRSCTKHRLKCDAALDHLDSAAVLSRHERGWSPGREAELPLGPIECEQIEGRRHGGKLLSLAAQFRRSTAADFDLRPYFQGPRCRRRGSAWRFR